MVIRQKIVLLSGAALLGLATPAMAQVETSAVSADDEADKEITVTATRIKDANFEAPTPMLAIGSDLVDQRGSTNIANIINELPAVTGTITPSSSNLNSRQNGVNAIDLRGLGTNRNLVLINGRRGTPFDEFENIDLNAVPSLAIDRVEVVTGGASAAWGSDAISGVVNLVFNDKIEGVKFNAQYGQSSRGDAENLRLSGVFGSKFGGGRGHVLLAADYDRNKGIPEGRARKWQRRSPALLNNPADVNDADGIPQYVIRDNAVLFLGSPNGVTLPGAGPTGNLEFFPDGTVRPRELGENLGGSHMVGGSGARLADRVALLIPTERFSVLGAARYEIVDGITLFGEASFARSKSRGALVDAFSFGGAVIRPDNPFLPASIAALNQPFALFRTFEEFPSITSVSVNETMRFVGGVRGSLGSSWSWDASLQHGRTDFSNDQPFNLLPAKLALAADAVRDPSTNQIICRANLGGANGAPGCAPINLFGKGSPSAAAIAYVTGIGTSDTKIRQTIMSANLSGELFQGWAGPIQTSFGIEHRKESLDRKVNAPNDNEEFLIVNAQPLRGKYHVTEGYAEVAVPIIAGAQKLDFNGAVRLTDYSTVGRVVTWKAGLVFSPIEELRFRGTISRDIRAPSIGETFVESVLLFENVANPFNGNIDFVQVPLSGNSNLTEERALTKTAGVVLTTGRFKASLDWYDINLKDAIGALGAQDIADRCFKGEQDLCSLISFGSNQTILSVKNQNLNLGSFQVQGLDFDARYALPVGSGKLSLGFVASYLIDKKIAPTGGTLIDVAGEVGPTSTGFGSPDFKATFSANYDVGPWGFFGQLRYIGSGIYDATFGPEQLSAKENHIGAVAYLDLSVKYDLDALVGSEAQIYAGMDNVLDRDPPVAPLNFISNTATNAAHYDVVGRKFYVGVRAKF